MPLIKRGKRCIIYKNNDDRDKSNQISDGESKPKQLAKEFEVYQCRLRHSGGTKWAYFPDDTPLYSKVGWDTLEEAKIFFLLQEI